MSEQGTKYLYKENIFYKRISNPNYTIINNKKIFQKINPPKSLKTQYEIINDVKLKTNERVELSENNTFVVNKKETQNQKNLKEKSEIKTYMKFQKVNV